VGQVGEPRTDARCTPGSALARVQDTEPPTWPFTTGVHHTSGLSPSVATSTYAIVLGPFLLPARALPDLVDFISPISCTPNSRSRCNLPLPVAGSVELTSMAPDIFDHRSGPPASWS